MICHIRSCSYSICGVCNNMNDFDCEYKDYRAIGTIDECQEAMEVKKKITKIVNQQLIAGKNNYKDVYECFYDIVKVIQDNY